ncbi:MAG: hypothetical protein OXE86_06055 [Alphaproteobacteria bacterium]|nr:hypothetical protein [Alphaproteobacteria bacterium]
MLASFTSSQLESHSQNKGNPQDSLNDGFALAFVPATSGTRLVADLDRCMTVEKALVVGWTRIHGLGSDEELRAFAQSPARM